MEWEQRFAQGGSRGPVLSRRNRSALSTELKQFLVSRVVLVDDLRKVDVPGPRVGMRVGNVVHPGRVMSAPYYRSIGVRGRYIFLLGLRSLLLGVLGWLLLVGLPVLRNRVRRAYMKGGRWVKVRGWSCRKWCYRVGERLIIKDDGICRGSGMHLLIKGCRNVWMRVGVTLKRGVLGWNG